MGKIYTITAGVLFAAVLSFSVSHAQTEPPINLPIFSATPTATATISADVITYYTVTPTPVATIASKEFVDDAETGSEIYFLAFFSLVAGIGLFFIKKYFDIKRYSI